MRPSLAGVCSLFLYLLSLSYGAQMTTPLPCNAGGNASDACEIQRVAWFSSKSAIVITYDNKAFLTNNEGQSFTQVGNKVNDIVEYPGHSEVMFLLPTSGQTVTYTMDGGVTFKTMTMPVGRAQVEAESFRVHPTQLGWLLLVGCTTGSNHLCTLYVSKNYGATWTASFNNNLAYETLGSPVKWGNSTSEPDLIFLLTKNYKFGYSTDYKTFTELFSEVFYFKITKYYYWVVEGSNGASRLLSSSYRLDPTHKAKHSYKVSAFPSSNTYAEQDFMFLDDTTRSEYVALNTASMGDYGDLYNSEFDGQSFSLSVPSVFRYEGPYGIWYDFHRVAGLGGIYIANVVVDTSARIPARQTVITFDNGGDWRLVAPPATDMFGNPWPCGKFGPGCSLHLQGESGVELSSVQALKSHSNAIGLIIANGNVGAQITQQPSLMSTFLSRDGGLTWTQIYSSATVFEFGNNGGVIVLVPYNVATTLVYYSFNQGTTPFLQSNVNLANQQYVYSLGTEPNGTGLNFIIQGYMGEATYFTTFSLSDVPLQNCADSDYEIFQPSNGLGSSDCFMGQTVSYLRRKATSVCYNARQTDVPIATVQCSCDWEDFECAPNYVPSIRNDTDGFECTQVEPSQTKFVCEPGTKYHDPTAYQLVPDTNCKLTGGLDLLGPEKSCPSNSHPGEIAAAVIVTLLIVGGIATVVVLYFKNERFRDWVKSLKGGRGEQRYKGLTSTDDDDEDNTVA